MRSVGCAPVCKIHVLIFQNFMKSVCLKFKPYFLGHLYSGIGANLNISRSHLYIMLHIYKTTGVYFK